MHPVKRVGADADGKMGHDLSIDCGGAKRAKVSAAVGMPNPHLTELNVDFLYHLGLNTSMDLKGKNEIMLLLLPIFIVTEVAVRFLGTRSDFRVHTAQPCLVTSASF